MKRNDNLSFTYDSVRLKPAEQIGMHHALSWELSYVETGSGTRHIGDTVEEFSAGEVVLIPPQIPHCWHFDEKDTGSDGCIANISLHFGDGLLSNCAAAFPELQHLMERLGCMREAVRLAPAQSGPIIELLERMREESDAERVASVLRILVLTAEYGQGTGVGSFHRRTSSEQRLEQIRTYVACNAHRHISIADIARHVGMCRTAFCVFFRHATGQTFIEYLNRHRLQSACQLLEEQEATISEICYTAGFNSIPYFNRTFKKGFGISPSEYRQKCKKQCNGA